MTSLESLSEKLLKLEQEILEINLRNKKVELNKAWETSKTRKISILIITYLIMVLVFWGMNVENPLLNALVPTLGFLLSTFSVSVVRKVWEG